MTDSIHLGPLILQRIGSTVVVHHSPTFNEEEWLTLRDLCSLASLSATSHAAQLAEIQRLDGELAKLRATLKNGTASDGYHTFNELYDHRIALFIALCSEVDARTPSGYVWRSKLHSNGSAIDGWFVMGIGTQPGEQITYHLPLSRWADTDWLGTENERAPGFDGHTSANVLQRLRRYFR